MVPTTDWPNDPALPGLDLVRALGLRTALPELPGEEPVGLRFIKHVSGSRAVAEGHAGGQHFAVKFYASDPSAEADLYRELPSLGLLGSPAFRIPRLLGINRDLHVLAVEWLDGVPLSHVVKDGEGDRAGRRAASWFQHASGMRLRSGRAAGPGYMLYRAGISARSLTSVDRPLGDVARRIASLLARTPPDPGSPRLVHGTLYARHLLDSGDVLGVIDWERYGQGPLELDAGVFLASIARIGAQRPGSAAAAASTEASFLEGTHGLLDLDALEWYRAAALILVAAGGTKSRDQAHAPVGAQAMLQQASVHTERWVRSRGSSLLPGPPVRRLPAVSREADSTTPG